jgi:F-box protein 1 (cyclin F)
MRYILIDWLFEVLEMKEFPSSTIHLAVNMVDSYLQQRPVPRSRLQLLGISAMLLAARWMGTQIITIREAAWLTDNTYKYEEVVQMMGELFAVFRGNIRVS